MAFGGIANEQLIEVGVNGPGNANRMYIIDGTAVFSLTPGPGNDSVSDTLSFQVGPTFPTGQFIRAIATASLANIFNRNLANNARWAVNQVDADFDDESGRVVVTANLAVEDTDGFLQRIGFQVNILARV
ncbi:MAG TPA: hypothetical protein VFI46_05450 [Jiangellaceae bacterium]|nr:hypothetical protein [Jiangellaceae bacterium]